MSNLVNISTISETDLLKLVPTERIEDLLKRNVKWRVLRTQSELLEWSVAKYNHCVATDTYERNINVPAEQHPLHKYFKTHSGRHDFSEVVDYHHNQVAIDGEVDNRVCVMLHIAVVYPASLHLGYIELANVNVPNQTPMDSEQQFAGIGSGVFAEIITNLKLFAKRLGLKRVTGYAVDMLRADIFCRRGFCLNENDPMFTMAVENNQQIPIVINLVD